MPDVKINMLLLRVDQTAHEATEFKWDKAERTPLGEYHVAVGQEPLQQVAVAPEAQAHYERMPRPVEETSVEARSLEISKIDVRKCANWTCIND